MHSYQAAQQDYKCLMVEVARRQMDIVLPGVTKEEVSLVLREGVKGGDSVNDASVRLLLKKKVSEDLEVNHGERDSVSSKAKWASASTKRQSVLIDKPSSLFKNALSVTSQKYNDVLLLESSLSELASMFSDFALLVEEQSSLLDNIEFQIGNAADYVDQGLDDTRDAVELQRKIRKKRCILVVICVGIAATLVVGFGLFK